MQTLWYILIARHLRRLTQRYPWMGRASDRFAFWALIVGCTVAIGGFLTTLVLS